MVDSVTMRDPQNSNPEAFFCFRITVVMFRLGTDRISVLFYIRFAAGYFTRYPVSSWIFVQISCFWLGCFYLISGLRLFEKRDKYLVWVQAYTHRALADCFPFVIPYSYRLCSCLNRWHPLYTSLIVPNRFNMQFPSPELKVTQKQKCASVL